MSNTSFWYDFHECVCIDGDKNNHNDDNDAVKHRRRIALGQAAWFQFYWLPVQQRKHSNFIFQIHNGSQLCISERVTTTENAADGSVSVNASSSTTSSPDWGKLVATAIKKIRVEDLGDLAAKDLLATIPAEDDSEGRGQKDLQRIEKQLSVKVVWLIEDDDNHILLVGAKAKLEKKCLVIRNILAHYYWRLKGKQINL